MACASTALVCTSALKVRGSGSCSKEWMESQMAFTKNPDKFTRSRTNCPPCWAQLTTAEQEPGFYNGPVQIIDTEGTMACKTQALLPHSHNLLRTNQAVCRP